MVMTHCDQCKKEYKTWKAWLKKAKNHFCSKKCAYLWHGEHFKGETHPQYKANTTNYFSVHNWMIRNHGVASECEMINCPYQNKRFVWALIHGKKYERKRKNFKQLCYKCHFKYDFNKEWHRNMIKGQHRRRYGV